MLACKHNHILPLKLGREGKYSLIRHSLSIPSYAPFADYAEEQKKPTIISLTNFRTCYLCNNVVYIRPSLERLSTLILLRSNAICHRDFFFPTLQEAGHRDDQRVSITCLFSEFTGKKRKYPSFIR